MKEMSNILIKTITNNSLEEFLEFLLNVIPFQPHPWKLEVKSKGHSLEPVASSRLQLHAQFVNQRKNVYAAMRHVHTLRKNVIVDVT